MNSQHVSTSRRVSNPRLEGTRLRDTQVTASDAGPVRGRVSNPSASSRAIGPNSAPPRPALSSQEDNQIVGQIAKTPDLLQPMSDRFSSSPPPLSHIDEGTLNRELDLRARQHYIVHLAKSDVELVLKAVIPGVTMSDAIFQQAKRKLQILFKTWKNRILRDAADWFEQWTQQSQNRQYANNTNFRELKVVLNQRFQMHWLPKVFAFAREAVDFDKCTISAKRWLKCK